MARKTTDYCDAPGCEVAAPVDNTAGSGIGWLRREVKDTIKLQLQVGVQEFSGSVVYRLCPKHVKQADELMAPPTHPEVLEFLQQKEKDDHG
jgi:hypothetical protein